MRFPDHMKRISENAEAKGISKSDYEIPIALIVIESWFRPLHFRIAEYFCYALKYNLTLGLCQARYDPFWSTTLNNDNCSLFRSIIAMEDLVHNVKTVEYFLKVNDLEGKSIDDILLKYTGGSSTHYRGLMIEILAEIKGNKKFNSVLSLDDATKR